MGWDKEELKNILQRDFIENVDVFNAGHRNDDVVDSMCICFALDEEWTEMYAKWVDNHHIDEDYFSHHLKTHYERIKKWLEDKEACGYTRGELDIMNYSINY